MKTADYDQAKQRLLCELKKAPHLDQEAAHTHAEGALMKFLRDSGQPEIAGAYEKCRDEVGFWYS